MNKKEYYTKFITKRKMVIGVKTMYKFVENEECSLEN